jgi:hypothetical protein
MMLFEPLVAREKDMQRMSITRTGRRHHDIPLDGFREAVSMSPQWVVSLCVDAVRKGTS